MDKRISIRIDEQTNQMLSDLLNLLQKESIGKITNSDIIRNAIEHTHKMYFPEKHSQVEQKNNLN